MADKRPKPTRPDPGLTEKKNCSPPGAPQPAWADGLWQVGNKIYGRCADCGALVRINKPILGGLHLCPPEAHGSGRF